MAGDGRGSIFALRGAPFRQRRTFVAALIAAAFTRANLGLFAEPRHRLRIGPARTSQIAIMLVAVLRETPAHAGRSLKAAQCASADPHLRTHMRPDAIRPALGLCELKMGMIITSAEAIQYLGSRRHCLIRGKREQYQGFCKPGSSVRSRSSCAASTARLRARSMWAIRLRRQR
jgi:hypothetical protein